MSKTRAIRLQDHEDKQVQDFLNQNPFFDFSSMARMAITRFITNPQIEIRPVKTRKPSAPRRSL